MHGESPSRDPKISTRRGRAPKELLVCFPGVLAAWAGAYGRPPQGRLFRKAGARQPNKPRLSNLSGMLAAWAGSSGKPPQGRLSTKACARQPSEPGATTTTTTSPGQVPTACPGSPESLPRKVIPKAWATQPTIHGRWGWRLESQAAPPTAAAAVLLLRPSRLESQAARWVWAHGLRTS